MSNEIRITCTNCLSEVIMDGTETENDATCNECGHVVIGTSQVNQALKALDRKMNQDERQEEKRRGKNA